MAVSSLILASLLLAQVSPRGGDVVPINGRRFDIPITINAEERAQIKRLQLYVSTDQGKTWNPTASAAPEQNKFVYTAPEDGLYWFSVAAVDAAGKQMPPSPFGVPPSLQILVDTAKPQVKSFTADRDGDEVVVNWDIQEDHPLLPTLHLEYRPQDAAPAAPWYTAPLPYNSQLKGETRFRPISTAALVLRLSMKDTADNQGEREITLAAANTNTAALPLTGNPTPPVVPPAPVAPSATANAVPAPPPVPEHSAPPPTFTSPVGREPLPTPAPLPPPVAGPREIARAGGPVDPIQQVVNIPAPAPTPSATALPRPQVINDKQISLEYEVRSGPSGLGKVELWITKDDGAHWEFLCEDPDLHSPITAQLEGEGIYGLRLVVQSGAGLGEGPPQPGEVPKLRVQVDLTPPLVRLYEPRPDQYQRDALVITWSASDQNLLPHPVKLEYAERAEGPWLPIAADLPPAGSHTWQMPKNVPCRVYLRASASDAAGNRTVAETREPVLIDLVKPEVLGVRMSAVSKRSSEPPAPVEVPSRTAPPVTETAPAAPRLDTGAVPPPAANTFAPSPGS